MKINDGTRGLSKEDGDAIEALCIFLDDYPVAEIDIEPMERGYKIRANRRNSETMFSSFGLNIREAVNNLVRAATIS